MTNAKQDKLEGQMQEWKKGLIVQISYRTNAGVGKMLKCRIEQTLGKKTKSGNNKVKQ